MQPPKVTLLEPGTAFSVTQTANWSDVFGAMYNVLFSITIVLAIGFTVFYAIKYMFSDIAGNKSYAKGMLMKPLFVVVGLGLAYLLWNDLNPSLLTSSPTFWRLANTVGGGVGSKEGYGDLFTNVAGSQSLPSGLVSTPNSMSTDFNKILATEALNRQTFSSAGISVNKNACKSTGDTSCTAVGGMQQRTIDMILKLKRDCVCDILITGGTEWWLHGATTRHRPDGSAVDLNLSQSLNEFMKTQKVTTKWSICDEAYVYEGFYFCKERTGSAPHWHIQ